ncbi:F-box domain protein [Aspergillus avenaceus]|uniref:F-box domain protein n=1 Tax=Aspergillus avenaceus TaxID=36643 RepID=A0A5N6U1F4_ASPAV|nr:F-box domain protein [Aspergillus avenaceus]
MPETVARRLLDVAPRETRSSLRLTCKRWCRAIDKVIPISRPTANVVPPEILLQIFFMLNPRDFDNARRTCSQWMKVSLDEHMLDCMLKRAGWWNSWMQDCQINRPFIHGEESTMWRMSRRFATECLLSGREINVEKAGFLTTILVDFSNSTSCQYANRSTRHKPSAGATSARGASAWPKFYTSFCGNYLLVSKGHLIYVYRLSNRGYRNMSPFWKDMDRSDLKFLASVTCPAEVVYATIDTSTSRIVIAVLLDNRSGMLYDIIPVDTDTTSDLGSSYKYVLSHIYRDICSAEDPPCSVSVCPGRRCVAFGSGSGIELRWVDEMTKQDRRKHLPISQPSEVLHFLPIRPVAPTELRLISSLSGSEFSKCQCPPASATARHLDYPSHSADVQSGHWKSKNEDLGLVKATHCHHYQAIPINDGLHFMFIEPQTKLLCIGSDAPFGGPTSLTKALVCVPPFQNNHVATYRNRLVLYSVPLDVFNVIRRERERQGDGVMGDSDLARDWFIDNERSLGCHESPAPNQNGDWEFLLNVSYRPTAMMWPFKIYGKEIGRVPDVVELSLQASSGGARVWAFSASGEAHVMDVDTFTSGTQRATDVPCKSVSVGADGKIASTRLVKRSELKSLTPISSYKRKQPDTQEVHGQEVYTYHLRALTDEHSALVPNAYSRAAFKRGVSFGACIIALDIPELNVSRGEGSDCICA